MTDLENDCFTLFIRVREAWTRGKITRWEFRELMGDIGKMIKRFETTTSGCPTGRHFAPCTCQRAIQGYAKHYTPRRPS